MTPVIVGDDTTRIGRRLLARETILASITA